MRYGGNFVLYLSGIVPKVFAMGSVVGDFTVICKLRFLFIIGWSW